MLFAWVFDWTQGDRGLDHGPMPAPFISKHHLGACSGVKVNAISNVVIAEPPMVVPEKFDLGIKMKLVASYLFVICQAVSPTQQLLPYAFRGCIKPGLHLGTDIASFFAGMT